MDNSSAGQTAAIESILFVAGEPVSLAHLARAIDADAETARDMVERLMFQYTEEKRGMCIIALEDGYQMCANPEHFTVIQRLYQNVKKKPMTPAVMETLAIIAYLQPVTKARIEEIRGVNADHAVNRLMEYGLVEETDRLDTPGRPIRFGTSQEFLRYFGFSSLSELPGMELEAAAPEENENEERTEEDI